ncbi:response regulator transcription factor [Streptomyces albus]|uniref:response regulator transcription factor n=1 Tax=Streptomyces albus TaxID=1888 RepID=UPI000689FB7A|nr:response regulator transcription factor [Streptomyces albus]
MIRVALLGTAGGRAALRAALTAPDITVVGPPRIPRPDRTAGPAAAEAEAEADGGLADADADAGSADPGGKDAAPAAAPADADLVLLAATPDGPPPLAAVRTLRSLPAPPPVVVLTSAPGTEYVAGCLAAGAAGVLDEQADGPVLLSCLRILASGGHVFPSPAAHVPAARAALHRPPPDVAGEHPGLTRLTLREREVLRLLSAGLTNPAISARLGITPATVKEHVSSTLRKLGVSSRTSAAVLAYRAGWTDGGPPEPPPPPAVPPLPAPP